MNYEDYEDLMYEFALMHKAALHYAGVKSECLETAAFKYAELFDEVQSDDDFKQILKCIEILKQKNPQFFN